MDGGRDHVYVVVNVVRWLFSPVEMFDALAM